MTPTHSRFHLNLLLRASLVLSASLAVVAMAVGSGKIVVQGETVNVPALNARECIAMDPAVFGSSAGQASIKAAPTIWSSRSNVRWNARWSEGRYLV